MIRIKYPEKEVACSYILEKEEIGFLDIIKLNTIIIGKASKERSPENQKLKSYDKRAILQILDYQKKHKLNNSKLAAHFKLSRNTVAKWKKLFL
ncbi:helix-turn-helix domain-containing protein [uncultured Chryseobacterium sp.]|uniref:helix-turn-helix domain-containing protein n=1 Tax=uncultured Chryseobacterium sp. TaxID=259322 RepID=UPI0025D41702|nr:helix-turn-helix domain-containing protein [uncultured Chryseobacterium sp.]